jgi:hypothetical protein
MTNVEDHLNRTITVPFGGGGGGGSRGPRNETFVSAVNGGGYYNVYPLDALCEKARKWKHGARVDCEFKDGKPDVLHFQEAEHHGHSLRKKNGQREHFALPTAVIGKVDGSSRASLSPRGAKATGSAFASAAFTQTQVTHD